MEKWNYYLLCIKVNTYFLWILPVKYDLDMVLTGSEVFIHSAVLCASVLQMVLWEYKQTKGWEAASEFTEQNWLLSGEDQWEPQWWIYYLRFVPLFLLPLSLTRSFIWMPGDLQYFPPEFPCLSLIHHLLSHLLSFSSPVCLICISTPSILSFSALDILSHLILHPFRSLALSTPQLVTPYWSSMCNWLSVFLSPQKSSGHFF